MVIEGNISKASLMRGLEKLNKTKLSRFCKAMLPEKNRNDHSLYALQLVKWGMGNFSLVGPWKASQDDLLYQANLMLDWQPKKVYKILRKDITPAELRKVNQQQIATYLIENLYDWLKSLKMALYEQEVVPINNALQSVQSKNQQMI